MVKALKFHGADVLAFCVGQRHWRGLVKCPKTSRDGKKVVGVIPTHMERSLQSLGTAVPRLLRNRIARHFMGIAKKESARALSREKLAHPGGVWASGCGVKPVKDRRHQIKAVKYIRDHTLEGAIVWLWFNALD